MLKLSINRSPFGEHSYFAEKTIAGSLLVSRVGRPSDFRYLEIRFVTNPDGQRSSLFSSAIVPEQFEEVARMMMEADPQAAVRAFGAVLQTAEVKRLDGNASESVAA
jgi:hypothetical protein